jgi:4-amino-4-deoxy-L-arabinose transferase-like glycosyltransferase
VRQLVRRHLRFFLIATAAAFALRLVFYWKLRFLGGDTFIYGDIAKNWLQHGTFAITNDGVLVPTYIRLPGYPAFLAGLWKIAGIEHYNAAIFTQIFVDVGTCFLTCALALSVVGQRAALAAFLLAALCPFTANYTITPLTETLSIFFATLTLLCAVKALDQPQSALRSWIGCGLAIAASMLLRPDGGLLLPAIVGYVLLCPGRRVRQRIATAALVSTLALAPLVPWTIRNWRVFHRFQPLTPKYANSPDEYLPMGYIHWARTWVVDYAAVEDVLWKVPGEKLDIDAMPARAFDNPREREETARLFDAYNKTLAPITPELDSQFAALAQRRREHSRFRYYVWLPLLRLADMWLRPREEALPIDPHWWEYKDDPRDAAIGVALGALNLVLIVAALMGAIRRKVRYAWLFILWVLLRCALLATLENPETRYTLECYPVVLIFAAANLKSRPEQERLVPANV